MSMMASQITSLTIGYSTVNSGTDKRKHQSSTSLAFVRGIQRWPVNSPHKGPVTQMFPFDEVIMFAHIFCDIKYVEHWPSSIWWHHQIEKFSMLLVLCEGNPPVTGGFPSQRPVMCSLDVFFDLHLNKQLSKQSNTSDLRCHHAHNDVTVM